jgi:hypothetical protein
MVGNITPRAAETLEQRLLRFFLRRIRRLAILDLYASAANVELLDMHTIGEFGGAKTNLWAAADPRNLLTGDPERDRQVVARLLKSSQTGTQAYDGGTDPADQIVGIPYEPDPADERPARRAIVAAARAFHHEPVRPVSGGASDSRPLLSLVRHFFHRLTSPGLRSPCSLPAPSDQVLREWPTFGTLCRDRTPSS